MRYKFCRDETKRAKPTGTLLQPGCSALNIGLNQGIVTPDPAFTSSGLKIYKEENMEAFIDYVVENWGAIVAATIAAMASIDKIGLMFFKTLSNLVEYYRDSFPGNSD